MGTVIGNKFMRGQCEVFSGREKLENVLSSSVIDILPHDLSFMQLLLIVKNN